MKNGFTMIELIFVIVILGVLAGVAVPKLTATRDDAKKTTEIGNAKTCLSDAAAAYTAGTSITQNISPACSAAASGTYVSATVATSSVTISGTGSSFLDTTHIVSGTSVSY